MEQELKNTLKSVQRQIRFPEEIDIKSILKKKKQFKSRNAVLLIAFIVIFMLLVPNVSTSLAGLFGTSTAPPHPYSQYLVHNAYYYIPTDQRVSKVQLGLKLGTTDRSGDWQFLREGDSTEFLPKSNYYSIKDKSTDEYIAVEKIGGTVRKPTIEYYQVLKRAKPVEKPDVKAIFGGKNDPLEVQAAYQNIRSVVPFLKILQSPELEMTSIVLRNDGSNYYVEMMYRPTQQSSMGQTIKIPGENHITDKVIFIQEYQSDFGKREEGFKHITNDGDFGYDPNQKIGEFFSNGAIWTQYRRGDREDKYYPLYTTKVNGVIYDVSSQGCSVEEMKKVLQTFTKAPKK